MPSYGPDGLSETLLMCIVCILHTPHSRAYVMRTNIIIDDQLIAEAQRLTGITTKKGVVEAARRLLVQLKQQE
jgi:Arc/MetJ family transcription regulator